MNVKWKVGDWCFCEFELAVVEDVADGRITGISTGYVHIGGDMTDRCFPLSKRTKLISAEFRSWKDKLRNIPGGSNFNWPDLHREFVERWVETCEHENDDDALRKNYDELKDFCEQIIEKNEQYRSMAVGGVPIFGRR